MNAEYVQEGAGNFLRMISEEKENFADEMFLHQEIPGFLPMEIRKINGKKEILYNVTGKIPLLVYMKENIVTLSDMRTFFSSIFDLQDELEEYLLDGCRLMIHPEYLYVERDGKHLWGIYREGSHNGNVAALGTFLEAVMEVMNQKDRDLVFFVYGMHKLTKSEGCTRADLREYLEKQEKGDKGNISSYERKKDGFCLSLQEKIQEKSEKRQEKCGENNKENKLPLLSGFIVLAAIVIPVVLWKNGMFDLPLTKSPDYPKLVGAFSFFLIVGIYAGSRVLPQNRNRIEKPYLKTEKEEEWDEICLIPEKKGERMIPMENFPFRIGADERYADVLLKGVDISPLHLQILSDGGVFYAVDQESVSGSCHNGKRMVPWEKEPLNDGDFLSVGSHEFVVEISSLP